MEEKVLDDKEAEELGIKIKPLPQDEPPMPEETTVEDGGMDGVNVPFTATLDEGYTEDGYEAEEIIPLDFSEVTEDDESLVMLTPEEAAAEVRRREEEARKLREEYEKLVAEGDVALAEKDYDLAKEKLSAANEIESDEVDMNVSYFRAYTRDFSMLDEFDVTAETYGLCYESAGEAFAEKVKKLFGDKATAEKERLEGIAKDKTATFESEQAERRTAFTARANKKNAQLLGFGIPLVVCAIVAIFCLAFINTIKGNLLVILSCVFGGLTVALLIPTLVFLKGFLDASRLVKENERMDTTALGLEILDLRDRISFYEEFLK